MISGGIDRDTLQSMSKVALESASSSAAMTAVAWSAPVWAQRHRLAFWVGTFSFLTCACVVTAARIPQTIPFSPN
jgi:hypothetical protein